MFQPYLVASSFGDIVIDKMSKTTDLWYTITIFRSQLSLSSAVELSVNLLCNSFLHRNILGEYFDCSLTISR